MARLVIMMGTKRVRAAFAIASNGLAPLATPIAAASTSKMPFETAMPMTISTPMSAVSEKPWPAASSASTIPGGAIGMVSSMTSGRRSDRTARSRS